MTAQGSDVSRGKNPHVKAKRIVFATFGSLGDVHPYLAIALELARRGHRPLIATTDVHRDAIESAGVDFAPMRPSAEHLGDPAELVRRLFHPIKGPQSLIRDVIMPHVRGAYEDIDRACKGADLVVTHPLAFAGRLVAEKRALPWRSTVLSPLSLMSSIDPPLFGPAPWLLWLRKLGVAPYRRAFDLIKLAAARWERPLHELRAELGLPRMEAPRYGRPGFQSKRRRVYAQFEGQYAPDANLALFSRVLASPQDDWPPSTTVCGFSRYDGPPMDAQSELDFHDWLNSGPPPIVFTLGSSVSMYAPAFFGLAIESARRLGCRALLVTGQDPSLLDAACAGMPDGAIKVFRYLPYSAVFPHAAVNVHQGGIGTLAQALAAGKPQLIAPVGFDQPDNALRAARLGISRTLAFQKINANAMTAALAELLISPPYSANADAIARTVLLEEQAQRAATLLSA